MRIPSVPASREVIEHAAAEHVKVCPGSVPYDCVCPCGTTVVIACAECDAAVFLCVRPGTWCEHAQAIHEKAGL
jgi:hypothetical protein